MEGYNPVEIWYINRTGTRNDGRGWIEIHRDLGIEPCMKNPLENTTMLTVTEKAQKQIADFLEGRRIQSIRIMKTDACPGPKLELGLDGVTDDDSVFEIVGTIYVVDKNLLAQAQTINIDFTDQGFEISSSLELGPQCSGCGTPNSRCGH